MARKQRADKTETGAPNTLLEAVKYFADADVAHGFVASLRWPERSSVLALREHSA